MWDLNERFTVILTHMIPEDLGRNYGNRVEDRHREFESRQVLPDLIHGAHGV